MLTIVVLLNCLTNCKLANQNNKKNNDSLVYGKLTNIYNTKLVDIPEGYTYNMNNIFMYNERIYALCSKFESLGNTGIYDYGIYHNILYSFDYEGKNIKEEIFEIYDEEGNIISDDMFIEYINIFPDGSYLIIDGRNLYFLSSDKILLKSSENLYQAFNVRTAGNWYIDTIISEDNIIYILRSDYIFVMTLEGEPLYFLENANNIQRIFELSNGDIILADFESPYNNKYYYINKINKKVEIYNRVEIPSNLTTSSYQLSIYSGIGYDIYYKNDIGIYGYNNDDTKAELLLNWINSDLIVTSVDIKHIISSDMIICTVYDFFSTEQNYGNRSSDSIGILTRVQDNELVPKEIITVTSIQTLGQILPAAIVSFNMENSNYRIVVEDYSKYENGRDITQFGLDIATGKIPDIVITNSLMPINSYISKGLFTDLYSYLEKHPELSILNCVKSVNEKDGQLYRIPWQFQITTLAGKTANVGKKPSMTIDEMIEIATNKPKDINMFTQLGNRFLLEYCLLSCMGDFVEYENAKCNFNDEIFLRLLNFCKDIPQSKLSGYFSNYLPLNEEAAAKAMNNEVYFLDNTLRNINSYMRLKFCFNDEDFVLKGFPTANGNGSIIVSDNWLSITETSAVKEGAFEFIKYLLSDKIQTSGNLTMWGLPVTMSALDILIDDMMKSYYYMRSFNDYTITKEKLSDNDMMRFGYKLIEMTERDVLVLKTLLNEIQITNTQDETVLAIIKEETSSFFAGAITAEKCAEYIQNRVQLYLHEQK